MAGSEEEARYSRQLYVLGGGAWRLPKSAVLVSGLRGTGAQVATALVLAGTGRVVLHDCHAACTADRTHQFLLGESDLGQNRAKASQRALAELNPHVVIETHSGELSEAFLASFQVVVLTESPLEEQLRVGDFCHAKGICFIVADAKGLAGQLFCDFGEHFDFDPAEGDPVSAAVQHISQGNPGVVTCMGTEDFRDGDLVTFSGVQGMTELNGQKPVPVRVLDTSRLEISDTSSFSPYRCGGLVSRVQQRKQCSHEPLCRALKEPRIKVANPEDLPRSHSLHAAFQALHAFRGKWDRLPRPRAPADAERVLELAWSLGAQQGPLDEDIVRAFASVSAGDLCPVAAVVGALAAQEVLKAVTRKFQPLNQWLYFDALECLALPGAAELTETDCAPRGSRYDGQIAVFGANFQEMLGHQKYLVVGAGAIGCELLKNFAMMGLAAGPDGELIITDMDTVALSNLHRQLLYRSADISEPKSVVAAAAVQRMNPDVRVTPHQNQMGPATEMLYRDNFFQHLDGVASALDTIEARTYLERRCLRCHTPLLDSGTEGTRGHVLAMVPSLTKPPEPASPRDGTFPLCTLRHFPHTIQHTLQWARDEFEGLFQLPAEQVNQFMDISSFCRQVWDSLRERPRDWQDCVRWARQHWQSRYHDAIIQLLHIYPPETVLAVLGFVGPLKQAPHGHPCSTSQDTHLDYVLATAQLFAQVHRVPPCRDQAAIQAVLRDVVLPPFSPQEGLQIPLIEEAAEEAQVPTGEVPRYVPGSSLDNNVHIDFITAASNLRAENYGISPADCKQIAGRIVPAIITTTAAVAGLACLEIYKLVWGSPIGTRLARGAPGRGQEEGEGGDSTALLWLQHHFGLMAAPQPRQTPGPALCHPGCSVPGLASSLNGGCCWVLPCPQVPAATPNTSMSQGEDTQCDISHPAAWLWWACLVWPMSPWGPGEPTLGASLFQRNMVPRAREMYSGGGGPWLSLCAEFSPR
uniref:E1 ubiquitin-activating enzyme n=1 Tax=Catharus ustulatus TaxID=91951 RepID=A0A8C3VDA2_CATUS